MLQINSENWQNRTAASLLHTIHLKMQHTEHTAHRTEANLQNCTIAGVVPVK